MEFTEYSDQLRNLGKRYLTEGTQACEQYVRAVSDLSHGKNNPNKFVQFAQNECVGFTKKILRCNVDYYLGVMNAGLGFSHSAFESAFDKQQTTTSTNSAENINPGTPDLNTQKFRTELHFTGKQGETVSQAFVMANNQQEPIDISFEVSEFVSADGQVKAHVPATFNPSQFKLEQGQEQIIECQVNFSDVLAPDQPHQAIARVVGYPDMQVRLILNS